MEQFEKADDYTLKIIITDVRERLVNVDGLLKEKSHLEATVLRLQNEIVRIQNELVKIESYIIKTEELGINQKEVLPVLDTAPLLNL